MCSRETQEGKKNEEEEDVEEITRISWYEEEEERGRGRIELLLQSSINSAALSNLRTTQSVFYDFLGKRKRKKNEKTKRIDGVIRGR